MAQPARMNLSIADLGSRALCNEVDDSEKSPYAIETPYGFQLDLDFLKYVDDIQSGNTLKKVNVHRRRRARPSVSTSGWTSTESLTSSTGLEDNKALPTTPKLRTHTAAYEIKDPTWSHPSYPTSPPPANSLLPPPSPKSSLRNIRVEKTLLETSRRLQQEQLTSEDGLGLAGSGSKVVAGPFGQSQVSPCPQRDPCVGNGELNSVSNPPFGGFFRFSPVNSGRSSPAVGITPGHLQHIREQMATGLRRLKELEEQVKEIPSLERRLQAVSEEKRQLVAELKKSKARSPGEDLLLLRQRSYSAGNVGIYQPEAQKMVMDLRLDLAAQHQEKRTSKIQELRRLTEKLSQGDRSRTSSKVGSPTSPSKEPPLRSVGVGEDVDMDQVVFYYKSERPTGEAAVGTEVEVTHVGVGVVETMLGLTTEAQEEIEFLQEIIEGQKANMVAIEGELEEAHHQLNTLKLRSLPPGACKETTDASVMARPRTVNASTETKVQLVSRAVGDHLEISDASVGPDPCPVPHDPSLSANLPVHGQCLRGLGPEVARDIHQALPTEQTETTVEQLVATGGEGTAAERSPGAETRETRRAAYQDGVTRVNLTKDTVQERRVAVKLCSTSLQVVCQRKASAEGGEDKPPEPPHTVGPTKGVLKSIMKKKDSSSNSEPSVGKKNLQFVGFLNGEYETSSSEESSGEEGSRDKVIADSSDSEVGNCSDSSDEDGVANLNDSDSDQCEGAEERRGEAGKEMPELGGQREAKAICEEEVKEKFELSSKMREVCLILKNHFNDPSPVKSKEVMSSLNAIQQEWFRVSSQKSASVQVVADYLMGFAEMSPAILTHVVNLSDANGNTALHYCVSHSNFHIVRLLLDTGVCNVDWQNKAGYTAIMLAALAALDTEAQMTIVRQMFSLGNVNAKASQAGQTALMLAVSHGRIEMVRALLGCGANVNSQDNEGSTSLMCACEHGRAEIVKVLLGQPECNVSLTDNDGSNAMTIALEADNKEIAAMLTARKNLESASQVVP
ncbi:KN motif and ankyrin repeat domain-containing protein 1-like isoform X2 [Amblyraja radiata]|uniref:KN motif and ankyrin repeat domain-containing protein 1-like isoform X2 n=1 Tax=Amblyraja radiata TaxID=386614 RepID=UPI001403E5B5|nr:KN motif and ankyrin repeat domain-containing protein 1-like isoform X2 [Amblyraja radiata]